MKASIDELLRSNSIKDRSKGMCRLFVPTAIVSYIGFQALMFGTAAYHNRNISSETSREVVRYINENVGPVGKASILGMLVAEEINSYKDSSN